MDKWFEIFKAGTHTDSNGVERSYSEADLDQIVSKYNPASHEAPIVVGHPKTNAPAFGWVESLKREGSVLMAKPKQVVAEFAEMVKQGLYKKRSISLFPDGSLRHVGFLGAAAPAVKGLADLEFKEEESGIVIDFEEVQEPVRVAIDTPPSGPSMKDFEDLKNQITTLTQKISGYETQFSERTEAQIQEQATANWLKTRKLDFETYLLDRLQYGTVTPAQKALINELLDAMAMINFKGDEQSGYFIEFSEGKQVNPFEVLKTLVNTFPKQVEFAEQATNQSAGKKVDLSPTEAAKKAQILVDEAIKSGQMLSYSEAVNQVYSEYQS